MKLEHITKIYTSKKGIKTKALDDVSLSLPSKGLIFLTGKSGAGKTTLIELISGLNTDYKGNIDYHGTSLKELSSSQLDAYRNSEIGFIFQNYALFEDKTVFENLEFVLRMNQRTDIEKIDEVLSSVGLLSHKDKYPHELSGGEQQRVAIARALLKNPSVIIADEPTAALDEENAIIVFELLKQIASSKLVLVVCHQDEFIQKYADGVIHLDEGKIKEASLPTVIEDIHPISTFTKAKLSLKDILHMTFKLESKLSHLLFNLFLLIFGITFLIISLSLTFYDEKKAILNTMYKNQQEIASFEVTPRSKKRIDTLHPISPYAKAIPLSTMSKIEESSPYSILKVNSQNESNNIYTIKFGTLEEDYISSYFEGYIQSNSIPSNFNFNLVYGTMPQNKNEIVLPMILFNDLKAQAQINEIKNLETYKDIAKYPVILEGNEYHVTGIYTLENLNLKRYFKVKNLSTPIETEKDALLQSASCAIIVHEDFEHPKLSHFYHLNFSSDLKGEVYSPGSTFFYTDEEKPLSSIQNDIYWFDKEQTALSQNEMILPASLLSNYEIKNIEEIKNLAIDALYFNKSLTYSKTSNFDTYPVKVVGVYTGNKETTIISKKISEIISERLAYDGIPSIAVQLSGNLHQDLKMIEWMETYDLTLSNNITVMTSRIHEPLSILQLVFFGLSAILFLLLIFMMLEYVNHLLKKNKYNIGLFRVLGYNVKQLVLPFICHNAILIFLACVGSLVLSFLGSTLLYQLFQYFTSTNISMMNTYWLSFGVVIPISFIVFIFMSYLLYYLKIKKKNAIGLIKDKEL